MSEHVKNAAAAEAAAAAPRELVINNHKLSKEDVTLLNPNREEDLGVLYIYWSSIYTPRYYGIQWSARNDAERVENAWFCTNDEQLTKQMEEFAAFMAAAAATTTSASCASVCDMINSPLMCKEVLDMAQELWDLYRAGDESVCQCFDTGVYASKADDSNNISEPPALLLFTSSVDKEMLAERLLKPLQEQYQKHCHQGDASADADVAADANDDDDENLSDLFCCITEDAMFWDWFFKNCDTMAVEERRDTETNTVETVCEPVYQLPKCLVEHVLETGQVPYAFGLEYDEKLKRCVPVALEECDLDHRYSLVDPTSGLYEDLEL